MGEEDDDIRLPAWMKAVRLHMTDRSWVLSADHTPVDDHRSDDLTLLPKFLRFLLILLERAFTC